MKPKTKKVASWQSKEKKEVVNTKLVMIETKKVTKAKKVTPSPSKK